MPLIEELIKDNWLKTPKVIEAFKKIKRSDFLPEDSKNLAEINEALPIGFGQTISQPLVVAFMMELLDLHEGDKVLDVGSGSGWTSALLAEIVGKKGKVISLDIIQELKDFGEKNVSKYNFVKKGIVQFFCLDGNNGYPNISSHPEFVEGFDKILASASAVNIPDSWKKQLKIGGRIVAPVDSSIWLLIKKNETDFEEKEHPGFIFVPLLKK
ncbi:MAG: protein-L-isoaspartate O-methyltransferase [Candidatus Pacebacteria bacterium]|nr:protein-L-isoaspartate O-methyltransferase [Candidatus Paceibacterota bacterium]